ncbi:hypothetical protein F2Q70_00014667 [Brassica cretica]|uniref:Uncharacterized protein n=1 Tax=Brassica cretica TaxID=69181 RepID=A0A8S9I3H5_BRACR|nr:hypothetical protein F2Q70_00014667 [Brassica cretica]
MEKQKKTYLKSFTEKVGPKSIQDMKEIIIAEEKNIRGSYEISTEWVPPESFVDHILEDSVFIMEFIITHGENSHDTKHTADVKQDLMLLENQLPFFIFQKLFGSHMEKLGIMGTVEQFILNFFSLRIKKKTNFRHFTDMFRCVYEESLEETPNLNDLTGEAIGEMANADNLSRAGVKFKKKKIFGGSYEKSTEWVSPESFVDHILEDSVFIMEFIITHGENSHDTRHTADVKQDLTLLENQLPFFIFQKLFGSHMDKLDMFRYGYEESLEETPNLNDLTGEAIGEMANADNLSHAGVKFKTPSQWKSSEQDRSHSRNLQPMTSISSGKETDDYSLHVSFKEGCLVMSSFRADEASETILRNVIAFEQSHGAVNPFTSNYINFINLLITNERDVEVLTAEGVLRNRMGSPNLVVQMINDLNRGLKEPTSSQYRSIAMNLKAHYKSRRNRCWATLSKVYFPDLLTGTATCAAVFLLFLTLVGTVASVIQAYKSFESVPPTIIYMTSKADQRKDAP